MKATALLAAAALVCGTAAFAQQQDNAAARGETTANTDSMRPADDAPRTKNAVKNLGHKTRNAMHRAGDKMRDVAGNDKDGDKHARADRHDTRAMGAGRSDMRDQDGSRRQRMDDAYANWKRKNG